MSAHSTNDDPTREHCQCNVCRNYNDCPCGKKKGYCILKTHTAQHRDHNGNDELEPSEDEGDFFGGGGGGGGRPPTPPPRSPPHRAPTPPRPHRAPTPPLGSQSNPRHPSAARDRPITAQRRRPPSLHATAYDHLSKFGGPLSKTAIINEIKDDFNRYEDRQAAIDNGIPETIEDCINILDADVTPIAPTSAKYGICRDCEYILGFETEFREGDQCPGCGKVLESERIWWQMIFLIEFFVRKLFLEWETIEALEYGFNYVSTGDSYGDFPDGEVYKRLRRENIILHKHDVVITVSTDGLQPFSHRCASQSDNPLDLWPLYFQVMVGPELRNDPRFRGVLWVTDSKMQVDKLLELITPYLVKWGLDGINVKYPGETVERNRKVIVLNFIGDAPATADVGGFAHHSAMVFCRYCSIRGQDINTVPEYAGQPHLDSNLYNACPWFRSAPGQPATEGPAPLRTHQEMMVDGTAAALDASGLVQEQSGMRKVTALSELPGFRYSEFFALDLMHSVFHGYLKKLFYHYIEVEGCFTADDVTNLMADFEADVPSDWDMKCRDFSRYKTFSAETWFVFFMVYSLPVMSVVLHNAPDHFLNFQLLHAALRMVFQLKPTAAEVDLAEQLLWEHMQTTSELFGRCRVYTWSFHSLAHICEQIRLHGSARLLGVWAFERRHQFLKRMVHGAGNAALAVYDRLRTVLWLSYIKVLRPELAAQPPRKTRNFSMVDASQNRLSNQCDPYHNPAVTAAFGQAYEDMFEGEPTFATAYLAHLPKKMNRVRSKAYDDDHASSRVVYQVDGEGECYGTVQHFYSWEEPVTEKKHFYALIRRFGVDRLFCTLPVLYSLVERNEAAIYDLVLVANIRGKFAMLEINNETLPDERLGVTYGRIDRGEAVVV